MNKNFILASFSSLIFALFFELVLLMFIGCVERPDPNCFRCRYQEEMYIFVHGSNLLLMPTTFFPLLLCSSKYACLAAFVVLAILVISSLLYQGFTLKHTESIKKYREHDSELNHFSELSLAMVLLLFTGLSSFVFSSATLLNGNIKLRSSSVFCSLLSS
jgi:hypothetical protein